MEVYNSLVDAVKAQSPTDTRRIYKFASGEDNLILVQDSFVIAASPKEAALALVGEDNISLVDRGERYTAMQQALHDVQEAHNAKLEKSKG